jgi:6-pyruvoyltetrahydropterin/6-carboxytetrahydropterin synthase
MYEVSVDETFAAAHNLRGYKGKCEDLHGHNYKVRVTVEGTELDSVGLLYDFVRLKQVISGVIRSLDHKYLNELSPFDLLNPSAENIARHIYDESVKQLERAPNGAGIASVTVWETETSAATYRP